MLQELINQHASLTGDLAQQLRELGDTRAAITRRQLAAWQQTSEYGITERREHVKYAVADLIADTEVQLGEIEALRAEVTTIEWQIRVLTRDG